VTESLIDLVKGLVVAMAVVERVNGLVVAMAVLDRVLVTEVVSETEVV